MKKTVSMLLVFAMVLTMMPMTVFAASNPNIYFETDFTTDLGVGDAFTVTANLENNESFGALTLSLKWNENAVAFTGFNVTKRGALETEVYTYTAPVINQDLGIVVGYDA